MDNQVGACEMSGKETDRIPTKTLLKQNTSVRPLYLEDGIRHSGARELSEEIEGVADGVLVQCRFVHLHLASFLYQHV